MGCLDKTSGIAHSILMSLNWMAACRAISLYAACGNVNNLTAAA